MTRTRQPEAGDTLAFQIKAVLGKDCGYKREHKFHDQRRWRFDFAFTERLHQVRAGAGAVTLSPKSSIKGLPMSAGCRMHLKISGARRPTATGSSAAVLRCVSEREREQTSFGFKANPTLKALGAGSGKGSSN